MEPELADVARLLKRSGMRHVLVNADEKSVFFGDHQLGAGVKLTAIPWSRDDGTGWFWRASVTYDSDGNYLSVPLGHRRGRGDRCPRPRHVVKFYRAAVAHRMSTKRQK